MRPHDLCRRCGHRFDTHGHYAVGFHTRDPMRWVNLCDECAEGLMAWIGIPPRLPDPKRGVVPEPPVSLCED